MSSSHSQLTKQTRLHTTHGVRRVARPWPHGPPRRKRPPRARGWAPPCGRPALQRSGRRSP
eukprot:8608341-Lingulodinium_polyedra.AAC.1